MSIFLIVGLMFFISALLPEDLDVFAIPKEFENCPEISHLKVYDKYLIKKGV